jgi:hypothetical protein
MNKSKKLEEYNRQGRTEDGAPKAMTESELREWHGCLAGVAQEALDEFVPEFWKDRLKYFSDIAADVPKSAGPVISASSQSDMLDPKPASPLPAAEESSEGVRAAARKAVVMPILASKRWKRGKWATKAGVGKNSVYEYLEGRRTLSDENRKAMAEALGLEPTDLPE